MSLSLGLLSDYEYVWWLLRGLSQTKQKTKKYIGIQILPPFLHVVVHAQEYVQRPVASLKMMS